MKPTNVVLPMNKSEIELLGDNHISTNTDTPLRKDAFDKSDEEKIHNIQYHFTQIMEELGLDLTDDSLSGTPYRVAKMYVNEIFNGLNPKNKPKASTFDNKYQRANSLPFSSVTKLITRRHSGACDDNFSDFLCNSTFVSPTKR